MTDLELDVDMFTNANRVGETLEYVNALQAFIKEVAAGNSPRLLLALPESATLRSIALRYTPAEYLTDNSDGVLMFIAPTMRQAVEAQKRIALLETELDLGADVLPTPYGSSTIGRGVDLVVLDAAPTPGTDTTRGAALEWYRTSVYTRLKPGGGVLMVKPAAHHDTLADDIAAASDGEFVTYTYGENTG